MRTVEFSGILKNSWVPIVAQWKWIWLVFKRMQVQSLASLSGSGIQHDCELQCRLQKRLGSCIAMAVQNGSCSSDLTSSLGTSVCHKCSSKKKKKKILQRQWEVKIKGLPLSHLGIFSLAGSLRPWLKEIYLHDVMNQIQSWCHSPGGECPDNHPEITGNGYVCGSNVFWEAEMMWKMASMARKGFTKFLFSSAWSHVDGTLSEVLGSSSSPVKSLVSPLSHGYFYSNTNTSW